MLTKKIVITFENSGLMNLMFSKSFGDEEKDHTYGFEPSFLNPILTDSELKEFFSLLKLEKSKKVKEFQLSLY